MIEPLKTQNVRKIMGDNPHLCAECGDRLVVIGINGEWFVGCEYCCHAYYELAPSSWMIEALEENPDLEMDGDEE
jgi:ssDNA-binding Zn-finger/Zn-ribbon topoisomerase 1